MVISRHSYFLYIYCFTVILKMKSNIWQCYPISYTFYESDFSESDTRPTQVGEMDPWPVKWPNLGDLINWDQ